jgi:hypothetical protein
VIRSTTDWLIDYFLFYVPIKNISLLWRRHHCRWRAAKFRPMLGTQGLWAGRDLYRATPAVTRDLGFPGIIRRTIPFSRLLRHTRGCGESILTRILTCPHSVASYDTQGDVEDLFWQVLLVALQYFLSRDEGSGCLVNHSALIKWNRTGHRMRHDWRKLKQTCTAIWISLAINQVDKLLFCELGNSWFS